MLVVDPMLARCSIDILDQVDALARESKVVETLVRESKVVDTLVRESNSSCDDESLHVDPISRAPTAPSSLGIPLDPLLELVETAKGKYVSSNVSPGAG